MGHRKHSAPRRGSLAYLPRARASSIIPVIRTWPEVATEKPVLLGFGGFKAGSIHVITVDDREHTPNFGKPSYNPATVIATPAALVCGIRAYREVGGALQALTDVYAKELPKPLVRKVRISPRKEEIGLNLLTGHLGEIVRFSLLAYIQASEIGLSQKRPFFFEVPIGGADMKSQFEYAKSVLGKQVNVSEVVKPGSYIDVGAVSKGKGIEGPVTRQGIKRKQHKSRKSVRAVGVLGPWHPASVMYTVPRAGQHGSHQRVEYNKRILLMGNSTEKPITMKGGFLHYGEVKGDYIIVRGSVPGPVRRFIKLRLPLRPPTTKAQPPKIIEVSSASK